MDRMRREERERDRDRERMRERERQRRQFDPRRPEERGKGMFIFN